MDNRRKIVLAIILVAVVSAITLYSLAARQEAAAEREERVAVINLNGPIREVAAGIGGGGSITPQSVRRQLTKAENDNSIKAVVLRVDSPGGAIAASQEIAAMIKDFPRPIVISMGDTAASGGYYIAASADAIVAQPGTMTGSIGVILTLTNLQELYEKMGIEVEIIKSGEHKDMMQRTLTEEERNLLQTLSDEAYEQFVHHIASERDMDIETVTELATGQVYLGTQAHEVELVDKLGGEDVAIATAGDLAGLQDPQRYEIPSPSPFQQLRWLFQDAQIIISHLLMPEELRWLNMFEEYLHPRMKY